MIWFIVTYKRWKMSTFKKTKLWISLSLALILFYFVFLSPHTQIVVTIETHYGKNLDDLKEKILWPLFLLMCCRENRDRSEQNRIFCTLVSACHYFRTWCCYWCSRWWWNCKVSNYHHCYHPIKYCHLFWRWMYYISRFVFFLLLRLVFLLVHVKRSKTVSLFGWTI